MELNTYQWIQKKLAAYCTDRSKDPLLISECPFWASLYWAYSFRTKMLEKQHQVDIFLKWKPNWTNLPGLDVVWFPIPGSPLASRMSRGVAVSAVSGASAVFRVFKTYDPQTWWHDLSTWARCCMVSQPRFSSGFSALKACCCFCCFCCVQGFYWHFCPWFVEDDTCKHADILLKVDLSTFSQPRLCFSFQALKSCCCFRCFGCFQSFCWHFYWNRSLVLRMCNVMY